MLMLDIIRNLEITGGWTLTSASYKNNFDKTAKHRYQGFNSEPM